MTSYALVTVLLGVESAALIAWLSRLGTRSIFAVAALVWHFVMYGLGVPLAAAQISSGAVDQDALQQIAEMSLLAPLSMAVAVRVLRPRRAERAPHFIPATFTRSSTVLLLVLGWLARAASIALGLALHSSVLDTNLWWTAPLQLSGQMALVGLLIGLGLRLFGRVSTTLIIVAEVVWSLQTGSRETLLAALAGVFILTFLRAASSTRRRLAVSAVVVGFFAATVLFPLLSRYRDVLYWRPDVDRITAVQMALAGENPSREESSMLSRISVASSASTAVYMEQHGLYVGGWESPQATLARIALLPVPRLLAPGKDDPGRIGNEFGRACGLVRAMDTRTSIAIGFLAQGVLLGGPAGVILLYFGFGLAVGALGRWLLSDTQQVVPTAVALAILVAVSQSQESLFDVALAQTFKELLVLLLVVHAANKFPRTRMKKAGHRV